ncbi:MFS transporter [Streptomyces orinoci]|uniref:MFS transporter n=1 Tax=Streptomyces orinoci TaxID=67339 RepID=A0ABV3JQ40_STRON|nr:MFS transporter [Streptomyces orinoci]
MPATVLVRERPRPRVIRESPYAWRLAVATVCFGAFMGQLDASIVTLTFGSLRTEFGASAAAVEWVSLGYLLTLVALLVPAGRLSDAHGRKLLYLYGFLLFTLASAACGLAPSLAALTGFRVVQAGGAALMQANSVALVTTSAPRGRLRAALGAQAAAQALGLALGPTVGGALVTTLGWRWVFTINVPIGAVALLAGHYLLPRSRTRDRSPGFDWPGLAWLATATTTLLLGVSAASAPAVPRWAAPVLLLAAAAAGRGFLLRQRRAAHPLVDLAVLRGRAVATGLSAALCGYLVLFGPLVLVPVVVTSSGASELTAGTVLTALPAGFALGAVGGDRMVPRRLGDRSRCLLGAALAAAALAVLTVLTPHRDGLVPLLALLGLGLGIFTPANNALVMSAMPTGRSGTGGGLVNMARGLGTALGVALVTLALAPGLAPGEPAALLILLAVALTGGTLSWLGPRDRRGA